MFVKILISPMNSSLRLSISSLSYKLSYPYPELTLCHSLASFLFEVIGHFCKQTFEFSVYHFNHLGSCDLLEVLCCLACLDSSPSFVWRIFLGRSLLLGTFSSTTQEGGNRLHLGWYWTQLVRCQTYPRSCLCFGNILSLDTSVAEQTESYRGSLKMNL